MKKFDRLPPETRKEEIKSAALKLFNEKGFANTTMENIVENVTLSKGGVYRLYPSTSAILSDLIIGGMRMRNAYYEKCVKPLVLKGEKLNARFLIEMIADSMLLYPEFSAVYTEFLWEKRRIPELEKLYTEICSTSVTETVELIKKYGADELLLSDSNTLIKITELMNSAILSINVLNLKKDFTESKPLLCSAIMNILKI